jgi:hypothetical protein
MKLPTLRSPAVGEEDPDTTFEIREPSMYDEPIP